GGLAVLAPCLRGSAAPAGIEAALPRFSRLAFAAVTVLVLTGTYQAWRAVGSAPALWATGYGRLLAAKIGAVAVVLALGSASGRIVHRRHSRHRLRTTV